MIITIPLKPVSAPRQNYSKRRQDLAHLERYFLFSEEVRTHWRKTGLSFPNSGASLYFYFPMPQSWPKWKKEEMAGAYHEQKPDLDNVLKGSIDSLFYQNGKVKIPQHQGRDDASIAHYGELAKYWVYPGEERIEVHLPETSDPLNLVRHHLQRALSVRQNMIKQEGELEFEDFIETQIEGAIEAVELIMRYKRGGSR